jgi:hypothetical protein
VFDAFIAEVVEQIINVDRAVWNIHDRWNILNACLQADVLILTEVPGGRFQLTYQDEEEQLPVAPLTHDTVEDTQNSMKVPGFLHDVERARQLMQDHPEISALDLATALGLKSAVYAQTLKVFIHTQREEEA